VYGKEEALFCASGTMTNQIGIVINLGPLQEVICDARSHVHINEVGGIHYHGRGSVKPIQHDQHHLTAELIERHLNFSNSSYHKPITRLIVLENTLNGRIFPLDEIIRIHQLAKKHNLKLHLDGARLWNATIASGHSLSDYCQYFDTISLCLSKGLGAPVGSLLVSNQLDINRARHFRKLFGGGWRQAGILAAAGLYAINHQWQRLKEDHDNAKYLANELETLGFIIIEPTESNMVWIDSSRLSVPIQNMIEYLKNHHSILLSSGPVLNSNYQARLILHIQTPYDSVLKFLSAVRNFLQHHKNFSPKL